MMNVALMNDLICKHHSNSACGRGGIIPERYLSRAAQLKLNKLLSGGYLVTVGHRKVNDNGYVSNEPLFMVNLPLVKDYIKRNED